MTKNLRSATDVLEHYKLNTAPIDIEKICRDLGITIQPDDFTELGKEFGHPISGLIYFDKEKDVRVILVNKEENLMRRRFTIAHELGHYFLHFTDEDKKDGAFVSFRGSSSPRETEANKFARDLLMPEDLVRQEYDMCFVRTSSYLADVFQVSNKAMQIRLEELGLEYV